MRIILFITFLLVIHSLSGQNNSLSFDGVNDYISCPGNSVLELEKGTIDLWIKPKQKSSKQTFIAYRAQDSWTRYLFNLLENISGIGFWNGSTYQTFSYQFTSDQWYHIAIVENNINTKVFINGVEEGQFNSEFGTASGPTLNLIFGVDVPFTEYFFGEIDEARIWNKVLNSSQINNIMECGFVGNEDCLVVYYDFNQGTAGGTNTTVTTLNDKSDNNINGNLLNFTLTGPSSNWVSSSLTYTGLCNLDPVICFDTLFSFQIRNDCYPQGPMDTLEMYETWWGRPEFIANFFSGTTSVPYDSITWNNLDPSIAYIEPPGVIKTNSGGSARIEGVYRDKKDTLYVKVTSPILPPEYVTPDPFLTTPAECAIKQIDVVILAYLPSDDGINLDVSKAPGFWVLNPKSLQEMKDTLDAYDKRIKFSLEEGTRYRDYGGDTQRPYIGYNIVEYIRVYEPTPRGPVLWVDQNGYPVYRVDHHSMFDRFNIKHYIEDLGVKEVWIWDYLMYSTIPAFDPAVHDPCDFRSGWESNMSSPLTGDISNSNRDPNDIPLYDNMYMLYGQSIRRSQAEAIHNRGHQFEAMFQHINWLQDGNTDMFWKKFVGQDANGQWITGRAGWTHMPPNTIVHNDFYNPTLVQSDIEDWRPDGLGNTKATNIDSWADIDYNWPGAQNFPQIVESQWFLYWMQSFPGHNNSIPYGSSFITNWWEIWYDWEGSVHNALGLYDNLPAPDESDIIFNGKDRGIGSLRHVIDCADPTSVISLHQDLTDDILITSDPLLVDKELTLDLGNQVDISCNGNLLFDINASGNLTLKNGQIGITDVNGKAFFNEGYLILSDISVQGINSILVDNRESILIKNQVEIKN